ncbi:BlaI/MecI/CopY family transcriptional regulator [Frankia sp. AgKG'84/4]|uniref:BlaI/MecI/CopY family transcriptional regulator n=1 Tax=Frankia sp. AgKG'84/4 TaxID=573490 RepID=UPI002029F9A6|nr:BlaI/MecI/CopY family transcriptional regulator [Frankia sp. AgKG'84/4]MCL9795692.1 BlaI/MecI/CopY family transcriptional regulator [Frankia sp. AgKG'84/4]
MPAASATRRAAGELERAVLALLWSAGEPLMPTAIQHRLGGGLAQSTVATTLLRLVAKGLADRAPHGRGFAYRPLQRAEQHAAIQMIDFLRRGDRPDDVLRHFARALPPGHREVLRAALTVAG